MKKILYVIAIVLTIGFKANAQIDSFISSWDDDSRDALDPFVISLPTTHYMDDNTPAPLGSGLLVLVVLGTGYTVVRNRDRH